MVMLKKDPNPLYQFVLVYPMEGITIDFLVVCLLCLVFYFFKPAVRRRGLSREIGAFDKHRIFLFTETATFQEQQLYIPRK